MDFEYEEFERLEDLFLYLSSIVPYMKQVVPVTSYKNYILSIVPLSQLSNIFLVAYTKVELQSGLFEFDISTRKYKDVNSIERADKNYFIVIKPKTSTMVKKAIENLEKQ